MELITRLDTLVLFSLSIYMAQKRPPDQNSMLCSE